ncbi:MAG TPA: cytochrome c [Bacteroidota bacterium]|nr:cytochrome c [Bacteroidota bacterium]
MTNSSLNLRRLLILCGFIPLALLVVGCESEQPGEQTQYRTDMVSQPSFKPQEDPLPHVAGTIPMSGYEPPIKDSVEATKLRNPFVFTRASEDTGKFLFNTYCSVCHGVAARGDGLVAPKFSTPPDLTAPMYRKVSDGYIYFVIRKGHIIMPSYYEHTTRRERWLIISHLRQLQQHD